MILIGVASGPEYFVERHVYRLMYKKYNFLKVVFFMGASMNHSLNVIINRENSIFNDMIIFSFLSSYYNLTSQLICELTWVNEYCRNFNWYIHHTSETYLNVKHIYSFLYKYMEKNCLLGYIIKKNMVQMKDKVFYIPQNVLNISVYPDYPSGFGYIVDKIALSEIGSIINEIHPKV